MKHAEALIKRILFQDGTPNLTELMKLSVGPNVQEQIESDLKLELQARGLYNRAIQIARDDGDSELPSRERDGFSGNARVENLHVDA